MLVLLSPSKSVNEKDRPQFAIKETAPHFTNVTNEIRKTLQKMTVNELETQLDVSEDLAELNYKRYQAWDDLDEKAAAWLYDGDVFSGFDSYSLSQSEAQFAQDHIQIVSGLYGLLRPSDRIKPYRLEMKTKLAGSWGADLYDAWQDILAEKITKSKLRVVVMCASREYAKAIGELPDSIRIITPRFFIQTDDGLKERGLFSKFMRGRYARWIVDQRVTNPRGLHNFALEDVRYDASRSNERELAFILPKGFTLKGRLS